MEKMAAAVRFVFLWCLAAIYLFAFLSLYFQVPGLYGRNGLLPAKLVLKDGKRSLWSNFKKQPSLLWFASRFGLDTETGMELNCLIGALISFGTLITQRLKHFITFFFLWLLYFSIYQVGQTFLWFQWDILLLETGFLAIFVAPWNFGSKFTGNSCDNVTFWLVKWLIFRLMFQSGVVKLTSQCPTWWGLTALNYHYESQCIPTPLAWYAHQLPDWFQRLSVVLTYVIEIVIPFLFFAPVRSLRIFSFYAQVFLQVLIILTGNYNFFNLNTIVLCLSLLDDKYLWHQSPKFVRALLARTMEEEPEPNEKESVVEKILKYITGILTGLSLFYWTMKLFSLKIDSKKVLTSKVAFSKDQYFDSLKTAVPLSIGIGLISLCYEILYAFYRSLKSKGILNKMLSSMQTVFFTSTAVWLFSVSLVPYTSIEYDTQANLWTIIRKWHDDTDHLQLSNVYGLFRSMTGVGGRPEIVIEGSNSMKGPWKEYDFLYKPGRLDESPPVNIPHQARLDWQMWFAALGSYQHNPWFIHLLYKLLHNEKDVLDLMGRNPFTKEPPTFIRSTLYLYHYTLLPRNTTGILDGISKSRTIKSWWFRDNKQEYTPILTKDNRDLKMFLNQYGLAMDTPWPEKPSGVLYRMIIGLRSWCPYLDPVISMVFLIVLAILICFVRSKMRAKVKNK